MVRNLQHGSPLLPKRLESLRRVIEEGWHWICNTGLLCCLSVEHGADESLEGGGIGFATRVSSSAKALSMAQTNH
jgi:hypothetical protein